MSLPAPTDPPPASQAASPPGALRDRQATLPIVATVLSILSLVVAAFSAVIAHRNLNIADRSSLAAEKSAAAAQLNAEIAQHALRIREQEQLPSVTVTSFLGPADRTKSRLSLMVRVSSQGAPITVEQVGFLIDDGELGPRLLKTTALKSLQLPIRLERLDSVLIELPVEDARELLHTRRACLGLAIVLGTGQQITLNDLDMQFFTDGRMAGIASQLRALEAVTDEIERERGKEAADHFRDQWQSPW